MPTSTIQRWTPFPTPASSTWTFPNFRTWVTRSRSSSRRRSPVPPAWTAPCSRLSSSPMLSGRTTESKKEPEAGKIAMASVTVQPSIPTALGDGGGRARSVASAARLQGWLRRLPVLPALVYVILVTQVPFLLTIFYSLQNWNLLSVAPARFIGLQNYLDVLNDATIRIAIWNTIVLTVCAVAIPVASIVGIEVWRWTPFMMLIVLAGLQSQNQEVLEAARVDGARALQMFRYITLPFIRPFIELGALLGSLFIVQSFDTIFMTTQG